MLSRNVGKHLSNHVAPHPRRTETSPAAWKLPSLPQFAHLSWSTSVRSITLCLFTRCFNVILPLISRYLMSIGFSDWTVYAPNIPPQVLLCRHVLFILILNKPINSKSSIFWKEFAPKKGIWMYGHRKSRGCSAVISMDLITRVVCWKWSNEKFYLINKWAKELRDRRMVYHEGLRGPTGCPLVHLLSSHHTWLSANSRTRGNGTTALFWFRALEFRQQILTYGTFQHN